MEILQKSERIETTTYTLSYEWNDMPGAGYGFPCNAQGDILWDEMPPAARDNYIACRDRAIEVTFKGIQPSINRYTKPAQGRCVCSKIVDLVSHTNECECGRLYNLFGQDLAPRSQWDYDLGEY